MFCISSKDTKEEDMRFNICPHCKKAFFSTNLDFFNHANECLTIDHTNSPITITWFRINESEDKDFLDNFEKIKKELINIRRPKTR